MNKFLILIAAFVLTIQFSNAQTTAGTQNLGFYVSYLSTKTNNLSIDPGYPTVTYVNRAADLSVGPSYSYFIVNNLDIGGILSYSSYTNSNSGGNSVSPENESNKEWGATAFIRKYFLYQNKIGFRTGLYVGYDRETLSYIYPPGQSAYNQNTNTNNYSAGLRLDIVYFPLKHLGIAATLASIGYDNFQSNNVTQGETSGNSFNANFTNGLALSMVYIF